MWKKVTNETFLNQELVFPAAQQSVLAIVKNAMLYEDVKRIYAFGSCVDSSFSPVSDIDIFVEQESDERHLLAKGLSRGVDYWTSANCDGSLMEEIQKKGVLVYER